MAQKPKLGISSCLLGEQVRFNGGHKKDNWLAAELAKHVDWQPLCPEVAIGLSVPRPTLRLISRSSAVIATDSDHQQQDYSASLRDVYHANRAAIEPLNGYVLMQGSPSCGMERVKLYNEGGMPTKSASGMFAHELMSQQPDLPVEEAGRLTDPALRDSFLCRVYLHFEWHKLLPTLTKGELIQFHSRHKYLIMLHNPAAYSKLGPMLSDLSNQDQLQSIAQQYFSTLMQALKSPGSRGSRCNTLLHLAGYFRTQLPSEERASLVALIHQYQQHKAPYIAPLMLLRHYAGLYREQLSYLWQQSVFNPYPDDLTDYGRNL